MNHFRFSFYGLPIIFFCWWVVYANQKSHAAFVWVSICWFIPYTLFVLIGYAYCERKLRKRKRKGGSNERQ